MTHVTRIKSYVNLLYLQITPLSPALDLPLYEDLSPCSASTPAPVSCHEAQPSPDCLDETLSSIASCHDAQPSTAACYEAISPASCYQAQAPCSPATSYTSCSSPGEPDPPLQKLTSALASCYEAPCSPEETEQLLQDLDDICSTDAPDHMVSTGITKIHFKVSHHSRGHSKSSVILGISNSSQRGVGINLHCHTI